MKDYSSEICFTKKDHHEIVYNLKVNLKFEIFKYLGNFNSKFQIKMIWGFFVFFKKNLKTNSYPIYNKKTKKIISNVKNILFDSENILALSEIFFFLKSQKKKNPFKFNPNPFYIEFQYDINKKNAGNFSRLVN